MFDLNISPLDQLTPHDLAAFAMPPDYPPDYPLSLGHAAPHPFDADPGAVPWSFPDSATHSDPPSTCSGSPASSEFSLPLHAPQPQRAYEWGGEPAPKGAQADFAAAGDGFGFGFGAGESELQYALGMAGVGAGAAGDPVGASLNHAAYAPNGYAPYDGVDVYNALGVGINLDGGMGFTLDDLLQHPGFH